MEDVGLTPPPIDYRNPIVLSELRFKPSTEAVSFYAIQPIEGEPEQADHVGQLLIVWKPLGQFDVAMLRSAEGPSKSHIPSGTKVIGHINLTIDVPASPP